MSIVKMRKSHNFVEGFSNPNKKTRLINQSGLESPSYIYKIMEHY